MAGPINRVTIHGHVDWFPNPPNPPARFPPPPQRSQHPTEQQQAHHRQATSHASRSLSDSPLSPPPAGMNINTPSASNTPESSQPVKSQSQTIPIPRTQAELWDAVKKRAIQMFVEERDNPEFAPSTSNKSAGPLMHHKISWRSGQLMALIAICEDGSVKGYKGLTVGSQLWEEDRVFFEAALDEHIESMLKNLKTVAEVWMQAKPADGNKDKAATAPTAAVFGAEPTIGGPSASDNAARPSSKAKGKAKETDPVTPAKRASVGSASEGESTNTKTKKRRRDRQQEQDRRERQERDEKDRAAQEKVRQYYDQISVPTGHGLSAGAHIWSVGARARAPQLNSALSGFWTQDELDRWFMAVRSDKGRLQNILPMEPTAHDLFDRFQFALRPVRCPDEPNKRLFLQFDLNLEIDPYTFNRRQLRARNPQPLTNYRAPIGGNDNDNQGYEKIRHGQVLEIENTDGDEDKLPSFDILEMAYALTRIIGALKGAGLHELMFRSDRPDGHPFAADDLISAEADDRRLPAFQELMLEAALESGVITEETRPMWRAVALAQEEAEEEERNRVMIRFLKLAGRMPKEQEVEDKEEEQGLGSSGDDTGPNKSRSF